MVTDKGTCLFGTACSREVSELFLEEGMFKQAHKGQVEVRQAKGNGSWSELEECFRYRGEQVRELGGRDEGTQQRGASVCLVTDCLSGLKAVARDEARKTGGEASQASYEFREIPRSRPCCLCWCFWNLVVI